MRISKVIRNYRKKENLTQEQLAKYLNVSTPAVNKWENGISYPDITILSPLARILKIDINTLLSYNEELTDLEINNFTKEISEIISKEGYIQGFKRGTCLIKEHPNCDELIMNISSILRIHLSVCDIDEKDKYEKNIITWLEIASSSNKEKIASGAKLLLSSIYKDKNEYRKSQELLDSIPELGINKTFQQALLFESIGKLNDAYSVYENMILKNANEIYTALSLIIKQLCKENKFNETEKYSECAKKLVETFDLGEFNKYSLDLFIAIEKQDKERTIEIIKNMVDKEDSINNFMNSKLYMHMTFKNPSHIRPDEYKKYTKVLIEKIKELDFIKDDYRVKSLLRSY